MKDEGRVFIMKAIYDALSEIQKKESYSDVEILDAVASVYGSLLKMLGLDDEFKAFNKYAIDIGCTIEKRSKNLN